MSSDNEETDFDGGTVSPAALAAKLGCRVAHLHLLEDDEIKDLTLPEKLAIRALKEEKKKSRSRGSKKRVDDEEVESDPVPISGDLTVDLLYYNNKSVKKRKITTLLQCYLQGAQMQTISTAGCFQRFSASGSMSAPKLRCSKDKAVVPTHTSGKKDKHSLVGFGKKEKLISGFNVALSSVDPKVQELWFCVEQSPRLDGDVEDIAKTTALSKLGLLKEAPFNITFRGSGAVLFEYDSRKAPDGSKEALLARVVRSSSGGWLLEPFRGEDSDLGCMIGCYKGKANKEYLMQPYMMAKLEANRLANETAVTSGVWNVVIHSGRDLVSCDRNGKSDPYVIISPESAQSKKAAKKYFSKSDTIKKTLNPEWNFEIKGIDTKDLYDGIMHLQLYDQDNPMRLTDYYIGGILGDDYMGEVYFNLREMDKEWLPVTTDGYAKRKAKGEVCVSCTRPRWSDRHDSSAGDKKKKSKKSSKGDEKKSSKKK